MSDKVQEMKEIERKLIAIHFESDESKINRELWYIKYFKRIMEKFKIIHDHSLFLIDRMVKTETLLDELDYTIEKYIDYLTIKKYAKELGWTEDQGNVSEYIIKHINTLQEENKKLNTDMDIITEEFHKQFINGHMP